MNIQIRRCEITDTKAIHELNARELGYNYSEDKTRDNLAKLLESSRDRIYVAQINGNVVGYVHANDYDLIYASHMKNIMGIAVSNSFQKMGIGKALLTAVEHWAKNSGACGVRLVSGAARTDAHRFYHQCGYTGDKKQINLKKLFINSSQKNSENSDVNFVEIQT